MINTSRSHAIYYGISIVLLQCLQEGFFNNLRILNTKPNLPLCFIMIIAARSSVTHSALLGLFSGIYIDIVYGRYIGFYGVLFMYFAIIVSLVSYSKLKEKTWWVLVIDIPCLFIYGIVESFFIRALTVYFDKAQSLYVDYLQHILTRILPVCLYNAAVIAVLLFPTLGILKLLIRKKKMNY